MSRKLSRYLKPDHYCASLDDLDFETLYANGYRLVLIDVDNTLARHGSFSADDYARRVVLRADQSGLACSIVSNAGQKRIQSYANTLGIPYYAWARKPSVKAILKACQAAGVSPRHTVMIGDQILTDIVSAHRAGCLAILVYPRYTQEAFHIRLKRFVEKLVFWRYRLRFDRPLRERLLHKGRKGGASRD